MTSGSSSMRDLGLGMQLLATRIEHSLKLANGKRVPWVLVLQMDNVVHYVSSTNAVDGIALLEELLMRWRSQAEESPALMKWDDCAVMLDLVERELDEAFRRVQALEDELRCANLALLEARGTSRSA